MAKQEATLLVKIKQTGQAALGSIKNGIAELGKAAVVAGTALAGFVGLSIRNFAKQEQAVNKLNTALLQNGEFTRENSKAIQAWASELQKSTNTADELVLENFALARSYTNSAEQAKKLTEAAIDFSKGAQITFVEALRRLGRSVQGATGDVANFASDIRNLSKEQLAAGASIDIIGAKYAGFAAQEALTTEGAIIRLKNNFGSLTELIGARFAPIISEIANRLSEFNVELQKSQGFAMGLASTFQFVLRAASLFKAVLVSIGKFLGTTFALRIGVIQGLISGSLTKAFENFALGVEQIKENVLNTFNKFRQEQSEIDALFDQQREDSLVGNQERLNQRLLNNEQTKQQKLEAHQQAELARLKEINKKELEEEAKKEKLRQQLNAKRLADTQQVFSTLTTLSQSNSKELIAIGKAAALANIAISTAQGIMLAYKTFPFPINIVLAGLVGAAGAIQAGNVAGVALAEGGIVNPRPGGVQATIGEGGSPEAVIPLTPEFLSNLGGGMTINLTVNGGLLGDANSARELAVALDDELLKLRQNNESVSFDSGII